MSFIINPFVFAAAGGSITTPSDLTDIWEWWEPSRGSFSDNDPIGTMAGQKSPGSGHNWTASGSLRPTYKASIVNGLGVARFDGTDDDMSGYNPSGLTSVHFFAVLKMDSNTPAADKSGLWNLGNTGGSQYPQPSSPTQIIIDSFRGTQETFSKSGIDVAQWRVMEIVSNSSEWIFKLDGTQLDSTAGNFSLGAFQSLGRSGPFDSAYLKGDLAGMYIMSAKLSSGNRTAMINYLNSRFGLSAS